MSRNNNKSILNGTKAEMLKNLYDNGFPVPEVSHFSVEDLLKKSERIVLDIQSKYNAHKNLAVRSSSQWGDTSDTSMARAFDSFLNIKTKNKDDIKKANYNSPISFCNISDSVSCFSQYPWNIFKRSIHSYFNCTFYFFDSNALF